MAACRFLEMAIRWTKEICHLALCKSSYKFKICKELFAMSALNEIFGNVIYSEVKHLFDEMESVFVSLTENYSLELSEELSDTELYQIIESSLSKWNEDIYMRADEWEKYFEMARNICSAIEKTQFDQITKRDTANCHIKNRPTTTLKICQLPHLLLKKWLNLKFNSYLCSIQMVFGWSRGLELKS